MPLNKMENVKVNIYHVNEVKVIDSLALHEIHANIGTSEVVLR